MRGVLRPALWAVAGTVVLSIAACNKGAQTIGPDEQAIRDLDAKAATLINSKDAVGVAALYADDGGVYPPNAPPAIGNEAVVASFTTLTQAPGFQLDFHPNKITISASKDLAVDVGTYTLKTGDTNAPQVERGKYVTTWLKLNGQWKMYTDMFSADTPSAPEAAAPAAAAAPPAAATDMPGSAPAAAGTVTPDSTQAPAAPTQPAAPAEGSPVQAAPATGEQPTPPAPVQQFGPGSPVQNAAPLMPTDSHAGPSSPAPTGSPSPVIPPAPQ